METVSFSAPVVGQTIGHHQQAILADNPQRFLDCLTRVLDPIGQQGHDDDIEGPFSAGRL